MVNKETSANKLRIIRFGGVLIFIGSFIFAFVFTGNDRFLRCCVAKGNSVKYCNDIYEDRKLAFQKEKDFVETKVDLKSKNLLFREETYANGNSYFGQFLNDKAHGFGTFIEANGDKYIGQWENGKMSGFGKLTFSDGEIYIGEFFKDKKHGQGMSISPAKDKEFSRWRYGKKNQDLKLYLFKNNSYF